MEDTLHRIRQEIDEVDRRLLDALAHRHRIIEQVAALKAAHQRPVRDASRERALLDTLGAEARAIGLSDHFVTTLFQHILDHSVRVQEDHLAGLTASPEPLVVAFQGVQGAYSHAAVLRHFASRSTELRAHGYLTFREAIGAVEAGEARYAVLPIENTTAGSITDVYDLLADASVHAVGEEVVKVEHCLIGLEEVPLKLLRKVFSHPQALAQCSTFLATLPNARAENYHDTALAVEKVRDDGDPAQAAIASEEAARRYGLPVLRRNVANQAENYTRFLVIAREPVVYDAVFACKTSLVFSVPHQHGALARCLAVFDDHRLNLTKLESRPQPNQPWQYRFYVDFEGNLNTPEVQRALDVLRPLTVSLKVIGSYPARVGPASQP